jgi:hypothetical protein
MQKIPDNFPLGKKRGKYCVVLMSVLVSENCQNVRSKSSNVRSEQTDVRSQKIKEGSYNVIGVIGEVGDRSNTDFRKVTLGVRKVYADTMRKPSKKTDEDCFMAREPNIGPPIPKDGIKVSEIAKEKHEFPYVRLAIHVSALWYWAIQRYKKHGIDMVMTRATFKKIAAKYSRGAGKFLGKDWEKHQKYINWYLSRTDKFARIECNFSEHYLSGLACYNMWVGEPTDEGFIDDPEERRTAGRWIREDD